jgi:hypothetical protein
VPLKEMDDPVTYVVATELVRSDEMPARGLTVTYEEIELAKEGRRASAARSIKSGRS